MESQVRLPLVTTSISSPNHDIKVQGAVEAASNPSVDAGLRQQALDFLNHVRGDPSAWMVGLTLFTKELPPSNIYVPNTRFFCLELISTAVASGTLDHNGLVSARIGLMDYVTRSYAATSTSPSDDPPFIRNKLAQTLTLLFTSLYADNWESFFTDLRALAEPSLRDPSASSAGLLFYLRMLASVHDEIADVLINVSPDRARVNGQLKDLVRNRDISAIAASWQEILAQWESLDPAAVQLCLHCMGRWVSWTDISLFANEQVVRHLLAIAGQQNTGHPESPASRSRDAAIGVFTEVVAKKMKPADKVALIKFLELDSVIERLLASPPLQDRNSPDYDTDMAETVAKLVNNVVLDVVEALNTEQLDPGARAGAEQLLQTSTTYVLRFLADEYDEICSTVIPALTDELALFRKITKAQGSLPAPYDGMTLPILDALVAKMRFDDTASWGEEGEETDEAEFEELRKRLRVAQQAVATIDEPMYLERLSRFVEQAFIRFRDARQQTDWRDLEVALAEMSLVGELAVRNSGLYQKRMPSSTAAQRLISLMSFMIDAGIASSEHPAVHVQYMELCVKFHSFFAQQKQYLPKVLEDFARFIHGMEVKTRIRAWHLFYRFVQRMRSDIAEYSETIVSAVSDLLPVRADPSDSRDGDDSESGPQAPEDPAFMAQLSLFEAVGSLSSAPNLPVEKQVTLVRGILAPLVSGLNESASAASSGDERAVLQMHHLIEAIGTVARGFSEWIPGRTSQVVPEEVSNEFQQASDAVLAALQKLRKFEPVREAARFAFARLIGVLGFRILRQLPQWIEGVLGDNSSSRDEIAVFLRLLGQVMFGFKHELQGIVDSLFTPLLQRVFRALGTPVAGTDDELRAAELRREYLNFLLVVLTEQNGLDGVLVSAANQPLFETVIASLEHYAKDTGDSSDARTALGVFTKMVERWGGPDVVAPPASASANGHATAPQPSLPGFDSFMATRFSALTWAVVTGEGFRLRDANANKALGEVAALQQAIYVKTGPLYLAHLRQTELPGLGLAQHVVEDYVTALTTMDVKAFKAWLVRFLTESRG